MTRAKHIFYESSVMSHVVTKVVNYFVVRKRKEGGGYYVCNCVLKKNWRGRRLTFESN